MKDHLPAPGLYIKKKLVSGLIYARLVCHLPGNIGHLRNNGPVSLSDINKTLDYQLRLIYRAVTIWSHLRIHQSS